MRLVHAGSPVGLPTRQAHAVQVTRMCEAFADLDLETCLLSAFPPESRHPVPVEELFSFYDVRPVFSIHRIRCLDPPLPTAARRLFRHLSYALRAWVHILRHFNDEQTIIYSRERFVSYLLLLSGKRLRARHVFESHNYLGERHTRLIVSLFSKLDRLVATTAFIGQKYVDTGVPADRVLLAPNGVDPNRFDIAESRSECRTRCKLPMDRPVIGYIGNFRNTMGMEKGIPELIRAQAQLLDRAGPNPPLLVCVGGPEESIPGYERLASGLGLGREHVLFPGYAARDEVPYWLRACDVLTIPWPQNEWAAYQTSPIKLFEYMASGSPVVASDLPSIREVLEHDVNALLAAPGNSSALAAAMAALLENPARARRLSDAARRSVGAYTWKNRAKKVLAGFLS